jgi:hypothetical protein
MQPWRSGNRIEGTKFPDGRAQWGRRQSQLNRESAKLQGIAATRSARSPAKENGRKK